VQIHQVVHHPRLEVVLYPVDDDLRANIDDLTVCHVRLEPIIMELERSENILIITHQAVLRCIYAYFMGSSQEKSPWMEVPLHTLIRLTPRAYKTEEERMYADIPAVSTWREKGSKAIHAQTESSKRGSPQITGETKA
jgi:6-phosphofructo-2-kinase / fructose-2,6-biphosphatase 2